MDKQTVYIPAMEVYSAINNELSSHTETLMSLKFIFQSQRNQSENVIHFMIHSDDILKR